VTDHADGGVANDSAIQRLAANRPLVAGLVVGIPTFILYWRTLMPDVGFWDTAEFQAIGPVLGIAHPTGYPTYTLLAWVASVLLQPFGNEAVRANLMSAIVTAIAVGLVAAIVTRLTARILIGIATGIALAVSGETWAIGLRADPHALHLMLATVLLLLLIVWQDQVASKGRPNPWLFAAAVVFGVSLGNHALTILLAPGIAIFVLLVQPRILLDWRLILACVAGLAVTTVAIYAYLPLRSLMNPPLDYANPVTWDNFRYLVFAEQFRGDFRRLPNFVDGLRQIANVTQQQLGLFAWLSLLGAFVAAWRRPALMLLLTAWFVINWYFALGYLNADIGRYYLVPIMCAAVFGGIGGGAVIDGLVAITRRFMSRQSASGPAAGEAAGGEGETASGQRREQMRGPILVLTAVFAALLLVPTVLNLPTRYKNLDASHDVAARQWLTSVTQRLPENSVLVSWWSYSTTMWYGQFVDHLRPDVTVIDDSTIVQHDLGTASDVINSYLGQRPVYLLRTTGDIAQFEQQYVLTPLEGVSGGTVYRVDGMRATNGSTTASSLQSAGV